MIIGINAEKLTEEKKTGVGNTVCSIISELTKQSVADEFWLYAPKKFSLSYIAGDNIKAKVIKFPRFWHRLALPLSLLFRKPDVFLEISAGLPVFAPKNSYIIIHDFAFKYFPAHYSRWERFLQERAVLSAIKKSKKIIFTTETNREDFYKFYHLPKSQTAVVPLAINTETFNQKSPTLDKIGFNYFLSVGRFEKRKNTLNLIKAFEIFKKKAQSSHKLILVGFPSFGWEEIEKEINNSHYRSDIVIRNYVKEDELAALYHQAVALVYPSFYEGFGFPLLEALACGTPVIASNIKNLKEVGGEVPYYIDPDSEEELAEMMYKIGFKQENYEKRKELGFKKAGEYSWQKTAEMIYKVITQ